MDPRAEPASKGTTSTPALNLRAADLGLPLVVAAAGTASLLYALSRRWNAQDMLPGIEGCVTTGIFGALLALCHGLRFSTVVKLFIPLFAIQYVIYRYVSAQAYGLLGIELIAVGGLGLAAAFIEALLRPQRAPAASVQASADPNARA
jgi:hypothetical protein